MKYAVLAALLLLTACDRDPVVTPPPPGTCVACSGTKAVTHRGRSVVCPRCEGAPTDVTVNIAARNARWEEWKTAHDTAGETCHALTSAKLDRSDRTCLVCKRPVEATHGWTLSPEGVAYYQTLSPYDQARLAVDAHALMDSMVKGFKSTGGKEVATRCPDCQGTGHTKTGTCDKCKGTGHAQGPMH